MYILIYTYVYFIAVIRLGHGDSPHFSKIYIPSLISFTYFMSNLNLTYTDVIRFWYIITVYYKHLVYYKHIYFRLRKIIPISPDLMYENSTLEIEIFNVRVFGHIYFVSIYSNLCA